MAPEEETRLHAEVEKAFIASLSSDEVMHALLGRAYHAATKKAIELTPKKKDAHVRIRLENSVYAIAGRWEKLVGYKE
jgi:hypothetical protein